MDLYVMIIMHMSWWSNTINLSNRSSIWNG